MVEADTDHRLTLLRASSAAAAIITSPINTEAAGSKEGFCTPSVSKAELPVTAATPNLAVAMTTSHAIAT
ncbi:MAG: hypothetical protein ABI794_10190 [Betaproteobacteria bacterium]